MKKFILTLSFLVLLYFVAFMMNARGQQVAQPSAEAVSQAKNLIENNLMNLNYRVGANESPLSKRAFIIVALPNSDIEGGPGDTWDNFLQTLEANGEMGVGMAKFSEYALKKKWIEITNSSKNFTCRLTPVGRVLVRLDKWDLSEDKAIFTKKIFIESHIGRYGEIKILDGVMTVEVFIYFDFEKPYKDFSSTMSDIIVKKFEGDFTNRPILYTFIEKDGRWALKSIN